MNKYLWMVLWLMPWVAWSQPRPSLTVEQIMADPRWIGSSPSDVFWSPDSRRVYFKWNPAGKLSDSLYYADVDDPEPRQCGAALRSRAVAERSGAWSADGRRLVYVEGHTLYLLDVAEGKRTALVTTASPITAPCFSFGGRQVVYRWGDNLYARNLKSGAITQLTNFRRGDEDGEPQPGRQERFLRADALHNSAVLRERARKDSLRKAAARGKPEDLPRPLYLGSSHLSGVCLSPDGRFVVYRLASRRGELHFSEVPDYVTASGLTDNIRSRPAVGRPQPSFSSFIYDRELDTVYPIDTRQIPGIRDVAEYLRDYPARDARLRRHPPVRKVCIRDPVWNPATNKGFVEIRSLDHKDRWLMLLDAASGKLKLLDRQHDSAWIAGPDIGWQQAGLSGISLAYFNVPTQVNGDKGPGYVGWVDDHTIWFQSERTGYSHLYLADTRTGRQRALTSGRYEVLQAELSFDGKRFNIITNRDDPGQRQFYQLDIATGIQTRITGAAGGNEVCVSFDGRKLAVLHSTAVHPWELYIQDNRPGSHPVRVTDKAESAAYKAYPWCTPETVTFRNRDGQRVYAALYRPDHALNSRPGVIFVHGAGYLQDVHAWWSYYFREHLFMNLLADQGYTVMDIDYRGSAGYGRSWRTAIYRHMGGRDLNDIVDGAHFMCDSLGVNARKMGIWGGSYGGFMTLMALFKTRVFACGAALRSVTDFAHYNHMYSSAILNTPQDDSLAYVRSSPLYFASGLHGQLLMCHGVVDTNVHFQDIVRLTQKLIELGKQDWQLAIYPVEGHDFREASSWTDEYRRIYKLFETCLR